MKIWVKGRKMVATVILLQEIDVSLCNVSSIDGNIILCVCVCVCVCVKGNTEGLVYYSNCSFHCTPCFPVNQFDA